VDVFDGLTLSDLSAGLETAFSGAEVTVALTCGFAVQTRAVLRR
jgi:hypothetical protein